MLPLVIMPRISSISQATEDEQLEQRLTLVMEAARGAESQVGLPAALYSPRPILLIHTSIPHLLGSC